MEEIVLPEIQGVKDDVKVLKDDVKTLKEDVSDLQDTTNRIERKLDIEIEYVDKLDKRVLKLEQKA